MSDLPCNLRQEIAAYMGQTEVEFRTDILLPQPYLLGPRDQAVICLKSTPFGPSNIALSWASISGATLYVVQWGTNPQMQGAAVRQVVTASTALALTRDIQIRIGETYHWRVFALNISGGVSPPSETRQFTFNCPEGTDPSTESDLFNVEAELLGPDTVRHCEDTTYYLKISFTNEDANQREICRYDDTEWEAELVGGADGSFDVTPEFGNDLKCNVNSRITGIVAANLKLKATINFTNLITSEEFTKEVTKEIISEPFTYGCGLTCDLQCVTDDPLEKTYKIAVDLQSIAGPGLYVIDNRNPPEGCPIDPCACPQLSIFPPEPCSTTPEVPCEGQCLWSWNNTTKLWEIVDDVCTPVVNCSVDGITQEPVATTLYWDFSEFTFTNLSRSPNFPIRPGDIIRYEFDITNISGAAIGYGHRQIVARFFNTGVTLIDANPSSFIQEVGVSNTSVVWNTLDGPVNSGFPDGYTATYYIDLQVGDECTDLELLAFPQYAVQLIDRLGVNSDPTVTRRQAIYGVYDDDTPPGGNGECKCDQPTFCGGTEGQQTNTYCTNLTTVEPDCGQTSTTPVPPCSCPTSPPECSPPVGCKWIWPIFATEWVLLEYNCVLGVCPCARPDVTGDEECGDTTTTPCVLIPPPGDPPPSPCDGNCSWLWIPGDPAEEGYWFYITGDCNRLSQFCGCIAPSAIPSIPANPCITDSTPCRTPPTSPPTDCETWQSENCYPCIESVAFTQLGVSYPLVECPTTTTLAPCSSLGCTWQWLRGGGSVEECVGYWFLVENNCPEECPCGEPPLDIPPTASECSGTSKTRCGSSSPTTTTTTTTTPAPTGRCCEPVDSGNCFVSTAADCAGIWTEGADCSGAWPCGLPPTIGGCCPPVGSCFVSTEAICHSIGGDFFEGMTCDTLECSGTCAPGEESFVGACCIEGICSLMQCGDCITAGGTWYPGISCAELGCSPPVTTTTSIPTTGPPPP